MYRIRYTPDMVKIRPYLGDQVHDDELYVRPGRRMPTLASALVVQARQRSGLTQLELAKRAGTSRSAISDIEHGKRDPGLERQLVLPQLEHALAEANQPSAPGPPPPSLRDVAYPTPPGAGPKARSTGRPPEDQPPALRRRR